MVSSTKLYCSPECQLKDTKGSHSPIPKNVPVHLTSQLPPSLSPMIRPAQFAPSPRLGPQHNDYSSNSSITSSPLQSPEPIPQGGDSPQKDPLDLPPPAFPHGHKEHHQFFGSVPVKIPTLVPRPAPPAVAAVGSQGTPLHGTSIDTLRFGRRPGVINSIISPNALLPRCACGKPANHRSRASSKERLAEPDFARLTLGPSVLHPSPRMVPVNLGDKPRVASDGMLGGRPAGVGRKATSGYTTPHDALGSSLLSRSRSDPIPPNLQYRDQSKRSDFHHHHAGFVSPSPSRRASAAAADLPTRAQASGRARAMTRTKSGDRPRARNMQPAPGHEAPPVEPRGRSRSRARLNDDEMALEPTGMLNHPPERESAPSRSRHRRDEHEREARYQNQHRTLDRVASARDEPVIAALDSPLVSPITPSWSRLADVGTGEGEVAPKRSSRGCGEQSRMERARAY